MKTSNWLPALLLALVAVPCFAADPADKAAGDRLAAEVKEPFTTLANVVSHVTKGDLEEGFKAYAERLIDAPKEKEAPEFESDYRSGFRRLFKAFPKGVESLDLVAIRRLSTRSFRLTCIANSRRGPVIVEAVTYRHKDSWWFCQIGFQSVELMDSERLRAFSESIPATALSQPISLPISSEPSNKLSSLEAK
ncbi:MAG: hypothetical protein IT428_20790 [Planctomycetaceae bacterium]|nr:hypothetical protein [Planctomycetaceae bacterium]